MDGIFTRILKHPLDYSGALRVHNLPFIAQTDLGNHTRSFSFAAPTGLEWKAGQHALFMLPGKSVQGKKWRAFSVASAPHENKVMIATTFPPEPSDFKQKLLSLRPGDKIRMFGPYGEFHTKKAAHTMIGIAGGIGITPFRSLLLHLAQQPVDSFSFTLIYGGKDNYFAFKDELQKAAEHPNITIHFTNTPDELNGKLDELVAENHNDATYYISGSPGMLTAIYEGLVKKGITHIINDPFKGY